MAVTHLKGFSVVLPYVFWILRVPGPDTLVLRLGVLVINMVIGMLCEAIHVTSSCRDIINAIAF